MRWHLCVDSEGRWAVVGATQRPDAGVLPGQIKANIPATVAFKVREALNSRILLGEENAGAASLPPLPGRGIWQWQTQTQFQAPWLARAEAEAMLARVYAPGAVPLRRVGFPPLPRPDGSAESAASDDEAPPPDETPHGDQRGRKADG